MSETTHSTNYGLKYIGTGREADFLVRLQKPDGFSEGEFYEQAGKVTSLLDDVLPAWCTFDWYRAPTGGPAVTVAGGPSAGGFYLDQDHNLDNHVFDI